MARQLAWYPAGSDTPVLLTDRAGGLRVGADVRGLGDASWEMSTEDSPQAEGTTVTDVWAPPRTVIMPIMISAPDRTTFLAKCRALKDSLNPYEPGELNLAQADGRNFWLRCRYKAGLDGEQGKDLGGDGTWWRTSLTLFAEDPFFYGDDVRLPYTYGGGSTTFLGDPFFPLRIGASQVIGSAQITNPGDVPAWLRWEITPPGNDVLLLNNTTGEQLQLTGTIPVGRTLTIETRPGRQDISLSDGTDWWNKLVGNPVLWQLAPGLNDISMTLSGANTGSSIILHTNYRYRTPW